MSARVKTDSRGVACPLCHAKAGQACRSMTTYKSNTSTHEARREAVRAATIRALEDAIAEQNARAENEEWAAVHQRLADEFAPLRDEEAAS